jgi:hypothetical protein
MNPKSFVHRNQNIPPHILAIIGPVPRAGGGVHRWLFVSSLKLQGRFPPDEIFGALRAAVTDCGRHVPDSEILAAVKNSAQGVVGQIPSSKVGSQSATWPKVDQVAVKRIVSSVDRPLARLSSASNSAELPLMQADFVPALVGILFPRDPLICAGHSVESMHCKHLSEWGTTLSETQFLVPSPMTARTGTNREWRTSTRCLANTGPRRFLVIEFDDLSIENQAAIHIHLSMRYPLALVVHSGGKSLHGWFFVAGSPDDELLGFMQYAVSLGADSHTWTRCQAVRTPGGLRRGGGQVRVQQVAFFNANYDA